MTQQDPDADLLPKIALGDAHATRLLVQRKLPKLLALGMRMLNDRGEAEDIAQETFVRLWKQAGQWKQGEAMLDTWLHRVALNLCYDKLRARPKGMQSLPDDAEILDIIKMDSMQIDSAPIPEESLAQRQESTRVTEALARLPSRQREALVLHYYQEMSQTAAAKLMDVSIDALESLLARARRNLRELLK